MPEPLPAPSISLGRALVEELSATAGEPAWLRDRRREAWEAFVRLPLPAADAEEWRRTDISALDLDAFGVLPHRAEKRRPPASVLGLAGDPAQAAGLRLVHDGVEIQSRVAPELARAGLIFCSLPEAVRAYPDLVREHLGTIVRDDENKFRALHGALWSGGTFLYVPKGCEVDLQFVSATWLDRAGIMFLPHTLVVAEERSRVTLVEMFGSAEGTERTLVNHAVELIPKPGALVRYVNLQEWGRHLWEFGIVRTAPERDATVHTLMVAFGASLVKTNVESRLVGQGSTSEMLGVAFGDHTQHFDFHTLQEHVAPNTTSDLLYKGVMKDKARLVFAGLIRADHGAQKTNAFQLNRNLLLNEGARADSMPKLEIMANDLRCTHGASTSRLNEDQIFYLMSRALPRSVAVRMMVDGFLSEIFDRIPLDMVRQRLSGTVERKMGDDA